MTYDPLDVDALWSDSQTKTRVLLESYGPPPEGTEWWETPEGRADALRRGEPAAVEAALNGLRGFGRIWFADDEDTP